MAGDDLDVEHLALIEHCELDRLAGRLIQIFHVGEGDLAQALLARNHLTELEQRHAEAPAAPRALEQPDVDELPSQAVGCRAG